MTDKEIDRWVEEHVVVPDDVSEEMKPLYDDIVPAITQWGKIVAKKFYELGCKAGAEAFKQSLNMY